jgi:excinuclease ABC subunit C
VKKIEDLELILTDNEMEAFILENNLIKQYKPRYNVNLKDDKSYPYIRVTNEPYPRIFHTRQIVRDGSKYFGPYTDVKNMKRSLRLINKIFRIRSCKYHIDEEVIRKKKIKICLDYHIKRCDAPCAGLISQEEYGKLVNQAVQVIRGKTDAIISELKKEMEKAARELQFEKAADLRDRIKQLGVYAARQKIVSGDFGDRDIIAVAYEGKDAACTVLNIRDGKLVGKRQFHLLLVGGEEESEIISSVLKFYYGEFVEVPKEILLEKEPSEKEFLIEWLNSKAERKVKFVIPQRASEAKSLIAMCKQNAILHLKEIQLQRMKKEGNLPYVLSALKRDLNLPSLPRKIECFDISNLQGTDSVASMVVFVDGKPKKSLYRKFIIRNVEGPDDFASMREVFERRYSKLLESGEPLPDLIMVDGGKGQLSAAVESLKKLGFKSFNIIGLAKRLEEIFKPGLSEAQTIPKTSSSLKLLQQVRDEAHRFAITFHRLRRSKRTLTTELKEIKGIGEKTAEKLLRDFKSIKQIKEASEEELGKSVGKAKAKLIRKYFDEQ